MMLQAIERAIGYRFRQPELARQALTHRSFGEPHNERLEFLGDAILSSAIAIALFARFGDLREGDLSRLRAQLVRQESLHRLAEAASLGEHLRLGEGELRSGGHRRPSILADALEAVIGAVYLDGGFAEAQAVIGRLYGPLLQALDPAKALKDPKTRLQEWLQGRRLALPVYVLRATRGEAHAQEFEVECQVAECGVAESGTGSSRRAAEQEAAQRAYQRLTGA
jgi:ribonuclease-3